MTRREGIHRRRVKQKLWEGIDSDDDDTLLDTTTPAHNNPEPTQSTVYRPLLHLIDDDDTASLRCFSSPSPPIMPSTLQSASLIKKPKDRCDVIAHLYSRGLRGEALEDEVRRRELEGRRRRGLPVESEDETPVAEKPKNTKASKASKGRAAQPKATHPKVASPSPGLYPVSAPLEVSSQQPSPFLTALRPCVPSPSPPPPSELSSGSDDVFNDVPVPIFVDASLARGAAYDRQLEDGEEDEYQKRWRARSAAPSMGALGSIMKTIDVASTDEPFESPIPRETVPAAMPSITPIMPTQESAMALANQWARTHVSSQQSCPPLITECDLMDNHMGPRSARPCQAGFPFNSNVGFDVTVYGTGDVERRLSVSQPTTPLQGYVQQGGHLPDEARTYYRCEITASVVPEPSKWDQACLQWEARGMLLNPEVTNTANTTTYRSWRAARLEHQFVGDINEVEASAVAAGVTAPSPTSGDFDIHDQSPIFDNPITLPVVADAGTYTAYASSSYTIPAPYSRLAEPTYGYPPDGPGLTQDFTYSPEGELIAYP